MMVFGPGLLLMAAISACNWATLAAWKVAGTTRPSSPSIAGRACRNVMRIFPSPMAHLPPWFEPPGPDITTPGQPGCSSRHDGDPIGCRSGCDQSEGQGRPEPLPCRIEYPHADS